MLNLKGLISRILNYLIYIEGLPKVKSIAISGTTSQYGTLTVAALAGYTIVGAVATSVSGNYYMVPYAGNTVGFFSYASPHAPLANTNVTATVYYI